MVVPDGDLIHIYDARTGEWTHIDTRTSRERRPAQGSRSVALSSAQSSAKRSRT